MQLAKWKKLLTRIPAVSAMAFLLMGNTKCPNNAPDFNWNPKIYAGDARTLSMVRKENGQLDQIMCADPRFDEMVSMHNSEIKNAKQAGFDLINQCEKWKTPEGQQNAENLRVILESLPVGDEQ
jgi:hypothetical protein